MTKIETVVEPLGGAKFLEAYINDTLVVLGTASKVEGKWLFAWNKLVEVESHQPDLMIRKAKSILRNQVKG